MERHLKHRRQLFLALHRQHQPLGHLLHAPLPCLRTLHSINPFANLPPRRLAQPRIPLRQLLLGLEQLRQLRRNRRRTLLEIWSNRKVHHRPQSCPGSLLHLLVHQHKMTAVLRIGKQRRTEDLATHLNLHPQPHPLSPGRINIERNPSHHPAKSSPQRHQHRPKSFRCTSCHAIPSRKIYTGSIVTPPKPRIFLSAGEASGDHYGAQLIAELRRRHPSLACFGLGGKEMEDVGLDRIVRAEDVAHMGITEVIRHMPRIYGEYRRLVAAIKQRRPDAAILIDFPDVNFRLARELKKNGIPVIYFVSPQLWAWKRSRLRWVQQRVNRMMVIFPFEERFYRARNVDAKFVGHPLAELPKPTISRQDYATAHGLDPAKPWIALLPGSRWKEVTANLDVMIEMAHRFPLHCDYILPVASTIDRKKLAEFMAGHEEWWPGDIDSALKVLNIRLVPDARDALHHARASVVASGTATVQATVIGNPFVVVYCVSPLTFRLAKRLVHYPPEIWDPTQLDADGNLPIAMVNLIAGRRIVPELLQDRFTAQNVAAALHPLLSDGPERERMIANLAEVRRALQPPAEISSIQQVCDAVEVLLHENLPEGGPNSPVSV
jgi:lipid-A-disaccharide synthase